MGTGGRPQADGKSDVRRLFLAGSERKNAASAPFGLDARFPDFGEGLRFVRDIAKIDLIK